MRHLWPIWRDHPEIHLEWTRKLQGTSMWGGDNSVMFWTWSHPNSSLEHYHLTDWPSWIQRKNEKQEEGISKCLWPILMGSGDLQEQLAESSSFCSIFKCITIAVESILKWVINKSINQSCLQLLNKSPVIQRPGDECEFIYEKSKQNLSCHTYNCICK